MRVNLSFFSRIKPYRFAHVLACLFCEPLFIMIFLGLGSWASDEVFYAVAKTHKCRSNKIYNTKLTMIKI